MPRNSSWNGKWSGAENLYARIESVTTQKASAKSEQIVAASPYYYSWPDGWCARIDVQIVDANESRKMRKKSRGFCGYEWMIDSIKTYGKIYADHEKPELAAV